MRVQHVVRRLLHAPMFTAITLVTLGIGVGANSAIFAVVEGVLLKPLPFPQADELVDVNHTAPGVNIERAGGAPFLYFTYRDEARSFEDVALWRTTTASLTGLAEPEEIRSLEVTDGLLPLLRVQPALGRVFTREDDSPDSAETVILTQGYWQSKFGGDRSVTGRRILLDGRASEIVGVLPATFKFLDTDAAILQPLRLNRERVFLGNFSYTLIGRLRPGVTIAQASADVSRLIPIAIERYPAPPGFRKGMFSEARLGPALQPLKQVLIGEVRRVLWVLMGTVAMVLLIACANVANLLLVRAEGRQHELAVRAALGAGTGRLARELLVESMTLGVLGGALGLALAYGALRLLVALAPAELPRIDEIGLDATVLVFTFATSLVAGVLFGLVPVAKYAGLQVAETLRGGGRSMSHSRDRHRSRNTLVVVQVALALVLLVSSGLMIRTFQALRHVHPGFEKAEDVQTLRISVPSSAAKDLVVAVRMEQQIADAIAAVPGVESVGMTTKVPMAPGGWRDPVFAEDHVYSETQIPPIRSFTFVSPGLLKTLGQPLIAGRDFTWTDVYEKRPVAMVSENLARELWGDPRAAIGKRIRETIKSPWREVVGVAGDVRDEGLNQKAPTVAYWPLFMENFSGDEIYTARTVAYMIRSSRAGSRPFVEEIGRAVWSVNANLPLANVRTLQEVYDRALARTSFTLVMLAIAGAMALLLGAAGIYGVIAYAVSQRTREIGLRMALGAQTVEVTRMFVGQGLRLTAIGVAFGLGAAYALTWLMSALLFGVSRTDPLTYAGVSIGLAASAMLASYVPARRATTVNPVEALRAE